MKLHRSNLIIIATCVLFLSSCVSKRKFEDLLRAKRNSDKRINELVKENNGLNEDLKNTISDFSKVRNEMSLSNSIKDSKIDSLSLSIQNLRSESSNLKEKFQDSKNEISYSQRQTESTIISLKAKIKKLEEEKASLKKNLQI